MKRAHEVIVACRRSGTLLLAVFAAVQGVYAQEGLSTEQRLVSAPRMPVKPSRVIEFNTQEGSLMTLDVSPDGKTIAFDLLGHLYILPIDGGKARRITEGMFYDWHPRFSPEGRQILFLSNRDGFENMHVVNADGSEVRRVSRLDRTEEPWFISPEWMPDGKSIVAGFLRGQWTHRGGAFDSINLFQFPLDGGAPTEFVLGPENVLGMSPTRVRGESISIARDGTRAYFLQGRINGSDRDAVSQIYMLDMKTRQVYPQTQLADGTFAPQVSPDGQWLVYATRKNADFGYRLRNLTTLEDHWLLFPIDGDLTGFDNVRGASHSAFTPDSRFFVTPLEGKIVKIAIPSGDMTNIPFEANVSTELAPLMKYDYRVDQGPGTARHVQFPRISADGKRVVFTAMQRVWIKDLPNGPPKRLVPNLDVGQFVPVWSPDGKRVAFLTFHETAGGNIYTASAEGTDVKRVTPDSKASYYASIEYAPDGKQLVYLRGSLASFLKNVMYERENRLEAFELRRTSASGGPSALITPVYPPALYYPQAKSNGYNWGYSWAWQNVMMPRPHFITGEPDRVYFYDGNAGLVAIGLDGANRTEYGKVRGSFPVTGGGSETMPAAEVILSPDGKQALATVGYHVYLIDRDLRQSADGFTFNVRATPIPESREGTVGKRGAATASNVSGTVRRLSTVGGFHFQWASDGSPYFSYASTLFRANRTISSSARPKEIPIRVNFGRDQPQGTFVLSGARIITMGQDGVIERGDVVVKNNRIVAVGPSGSVAVPAGAASFDVHGKTMMPGIIDTHCHAIADQPVPVRISQPWVWANYLAYGVTTCFEVWPPLTDFDDQDLLESGAMTGPRLYLTPLIEWYDAINSIDDARDIIDRAKYYRTNYFKEYIFGDLQAHEFIANAAHEQRVMGVLHSAGPVGGMSSILMNMVLGFPQEAHAFSVINAPRSALHDDLAKFVAQTGTALQAQMWEVEPTIPYIVPDPKHDPKAQHFYPARWLDARFNLRKNVTSSTGVTPPSIPGEDRIRISGVSKMYADLAKAGVLVASGEHGEVKGIGEHWTIWEMAAEMPNQTALEIATRNGAKSMGLTDLGAVEPGMLADLIILNLNPLKNIRNTLSIDRVVKNGRIYAGGTLAQLWPRQTVAPDFWWTHDDVPAYRPGTTPSGGIPEKLQSQ